MKKTLIYTFTYIGLGLTLFISLFLANSGRAFAASGEWVNAGQINVNGDAYIDRASLDDNINFKEGGVQDGCVSEIKGFSTGNIFNTGELSSATLFLRESDPLTGVCTALNGADGEALTLSNVDRSNDVFVWIDSGTLQGVNTGTIYSRLDGQDIFAEQTSNSCKNSVELSSQSTARFIDRKTDIVCVVDREWDVGLGNTTNSSLPPGTGESVIDSAEDVRPSCETEGGSFAWLLCPALFALDGAVDGVDSAVTSLLVVDYDRLTSTGGIENAWSRVRNIAYIILIPALLLMVIGTALGFNFLDPYTVKRALPRLFVAVIFISLSWDVCRIMIEVTNTVGQGVAGLIGSAVRDGGLSSLQLRDLFSPAESVATTGIVVGAGGLAIIGGLFASGIAGAFLLSIIGYALLLLLAAFFVLAIGFALLSLRQVLLVALIIVAPIAIITWIFPGNDKMWKLWWGSFTKLLMLFPIIIILITTGKAFAYIISETAVSSDLGPFGALLDFTLKFVAYIGPFFLIPATFKLAGTAFANLSGMVNDKSRGFLDRNRNRRKQLKGYMGKRVKEGAESGALFRKDSTLGKMGMNRTAMKATNLDKINSFKTWRRDLDEATQVAGMHHVEEGMKDEDMRPFDRDELSGALLDLRNGDEIGLAMNMSVQVKKKLLKTKYSNLVDQDTGEFIGTAADMKKINSEALSLSQGYASSALSKYKSGDQDGGYGDALDVFDVNEKDKNLALSTVARANRKYDDHTFDRVLALKAMSGGTYYRNAATTWRAAGKTTEGDSNGAAQMTVEGRKALMGAGRAESGAGGFGATIVLQDNASHATTVDELLELDVKHVNHVIDQNGLQTILHQSMKDGPTQENIIPVMQERLRAAYASGDETRINAETAGAEFLHKQLSSTKPVFAKMFGEQVIGYDPTNDKVVSTSEQSQNDQQWSVYIQAKQKRQVVVENVRAGKMFDGEGKALPKLPTDSSGNLVLPSEYDLPPEPPRLNIVRKQIQDRSSTSAYQNISWQYQQQEEAYQQQVAAGQAQQGQGPGGPGPGGQGPTGRGPVPPGP